MCAGLRLRALSFLPGGGADPAAGPPLVAHASASDELTEDPRYRHSPMIRKDHGTCATCHTSGKGEYFYRSKTDLFWAGMLDESHFPDRHNNPIEVYFVDDGLLHTLNGLTAMCTIDQLTRALIEVLGKYRVREFHYGTYWNGKIIHLNQRAIKICHRTGTGDSHSSVFAFTGAEIARAEDPQAGGPPVIMLEAVAMSRSDCPKRNTTNLPELSPGEAICCWWCKHYLDWRLCSASLFDLDMLS